MCIQTDPSLPHPPFKATLTGFRKTLLRKVHFCPRLAETKRKNIILDHMNSRICLGSSRYWLHKSDLITTKTAYYAIRWNQRSALRTQKPLISLPVSNSCEKEHKTPLDKRKSQNLVQFWRDFGLKNCFLASQDALEVMRVTHSLTYLLTYSLSHSALALTLLM